MKGIISYENGISRIETFDYPIEAVREALLNAIAHKDYMSDNPIQISVYEDKLIIWNEGQLPENWTIKTLLEKHISKPFNPDISYVFFRSGYIESWGTGLSKMERYCIEAGLPKPKYLFKQSGFWVEFRKEIEKMNPEKLKELGLNERQIKAVLYVEEHGKIGNGEYQKINGISKVTASKELKELVNVHYLFLMIGKVGFGTEYTSNW